MSEAKTSDKVAKIVTLIEELTVVEAFELKKALEEKFDVKASSGMSMAMMPAAASAEPVEEKTEFDVMLLDAGANKINTIKVVKTITGLGLKEAKDLVEGTLPQRIKEGAKKEEAAEIKKQLEEAGAKVEVK